MRMTSFIDRLKIFFLGVFAVSCALVWGYQLLWVAPAKKCESHGRWWDPSSRVCATPIYLPNLTGRPAGKLNAAQLKARAQDVRVQDATLFGLQPQAKPSK